MKRYRVAAGILRDASGRILITERLGDGPFDGLWEFPGGKIGAGENPADALRRELIEELGIEVLVSQPYMDLRHEYPDRTVDLEFFLVTQWQGDPSSLEGQQIRWVDPSELDPDVLLPADKPVVVALQSSMTI
jgi:8-oxo-dGTP diphosphatase